MGYTIIHDIIQDTRVNYTIEQVNKCLFMQMLYQKMFMYAQEHNQEFTNDCYIIQFNNKLNAKIIRKQLISYTGIFDIKFSHYEIALNCIKELDNYLQGVIKNEDKNTMSERME